MAPETYQRVDHASAVSKQPSTQDELRSAYRAMVSCPTGSIRLQRPDPMIKSVLEDFPLAVDKERLPGVYHLGFHSKDSYGGTPWLIVKEQGGVMIDSPRYSSKLAAAITTMLGGAPAYMLLTHEQSAASYQRPHAADDIADHAKWAAAFPTMKRIMHTGDIGKYRSVKPGVIEIELSDSNADRYIACDNGDKRAVWELAPDMLVIHTPGHTEGCVSLFFDSSSNSSSSSSNSSSGNTDSSSSSSSSSTDNSSSSSSSSTSSSSSESGSTTATTISKGEGVLFTGDHLAYSHSRSALTGFPGYNRAGLRKQADSIAVLAGNSSDSKCDAPNWHWVLPGHGRLTSFSSAAERSAAVHAAADALRADAQRLGRR
eukprot:6892-Heterococcus_DN1.PRE.2